VKRIGFANAATIARRVLDMYAEGQFDVATIVYARFKSVIAQEPTARRLIPAPIEDAGSAKRPPGAVYDYEPDEAEILAELLPRKRVGYRFFRALLETPRPSTGARIDRDGIGNPQCGRSDRQADLAIQTAQPPGDDHEGTIEIILRR
jgi:F-type H+-transporting ATPase subunit gamma